MTKPYPLSSGLSESAHSYQVPEEPTRDDARQLLEGFRRHGSPQGRKMAAAAMCMTRAEQRELLFLMVFALMNEAQMRHAVADLAMLATFQGTRQ